MLPAQLQEEHTQKVNDEGRVFSAWHLGLLTAISKRRWEEPCKML